LTITLSRTIVDFLAVIGCTIETNAEGLTLVLDDGTCIITEGVDGVAIQGTSRRRRGLLSSRHIEPVEKYLALAYGDQVRKTLGLPATHFLERPRELAAGFTLDGDDYFGGDLVWNDGNTRHRFTIPMTPVYDRTAAYLSQVFRFSLSDITDAFAQDAPRSASELKLFGHEVPGFERPFRLPAPLDAWLRAGNDAYDIGDEWVAYGDYSSGGHRIAVDGDTFLVHQRPEKGNDWHVPQLVAATFDALDAFLTWVNCSNWHPDGVPMRQVRMHDLAPGFTTTPRLGGRGLVTLHRGAQPVCKVRGSSAAALSHILAMGPEEARRRIREGEPLATSTRPGTPRRG